MHLVLYFCGTGNDGTGFWDGYDYQQELQKNGVKTIFVKGCDDKEVCNSGLFPNLSRYAKRMRSKLFHKNDDGTLKLTTHELESLKVGIRVDRSDIDEDDVDQSIESITLVGYSRGAVTCFNVAKELNKIAPNVQVNIVANQPVPGNSYTGPGTNAHSVADCSKLKNLRQVTVTLGSYTGEINGKKDPIHRGFFSQILPKLPQRTSLCKELVVVPRAHHNALKEGEVFGYNHMHYQLC